MSGGVLGLTGTAVALDVGRSLRASGWMLFDTFWALVLGFGLSGVIQTFASRTAMQRRLGNHRPAAVARASLFGVASSSCSYAAAAMARALVRTGADFTTAMVFMFASTNLVIELGVVLILLVGWQFALAEFVGGALMIGLLVAVGHVAFRGQSAGRTGSPAAADPAASEPNNERLAPSTWRAWKVAASVTLADLHMLRREILTGYLAAGALSVVVSVRVWNDLFLAGHGSATTIENAAVGPAIALLSAVCSVGNVPLAAALWTGGIAFGGVLSFVFADLLALPLLFVYRRLYGGPTMRRMLLVFWPVMSLAGLVTEVLFRAVGLVPNVHPVSVVRDRLGGAPTLGLDLVFLLILAVIVVLARHAPARASEADRDPVCGMQIDPDHAPAWTSPGGTVVRFCSDRCRERFVRNPEQFSISETGSASVASIQARQDPEITALCHEESPRTIEHDNALCEDAGKEGVWRRSS